MEAFNPATGERIFAVPDWSAAELGAALATTAAATPAWQATALAERARLLQQVAAELKRGRDDYARRITLEMGKPIREARAEIEKCAWGCEFYAEHAADFLRDEVIASGATKSCVAWLPLGTVLAIMPWNFPFWQAFRAAAPALMAGNTMVLKHASNVPQCAQGIEEIFHRAGLPAGVFRTLRISAAQTEALINDARIHAVTLTGSEAAGRRVAAAAGANLKKTVLELGGSDAFIVCADADLDAAAHTAVTARFQNAGQSCIAAKRLILVEAIAGEFLARFTPQVAALTVGDPLQEATQIGPLARADLRDALHQQVQASIRAGARALLGCAPLPGPGFFYAPSILENVRPGMPAYDDELFGPVAAILRVPDEAAALRVANDSRYGLGASVWTRDVARGERLARAIESGMGFVNGMVHSDPRLPFGGVKCSGYGRELSALGIREFVNAKTIWTR